MSNTTQQYAEELHQDLGAAYVYVRDRMGRKLQHQKAQYDANTQGRPFEKGDLTAPATPRGRSRKLHKPWTGPFREVEKLSDSVYRLHHTQNRRCRPVVHFNWLKPYPPDVRLPHKSLQTTLTQGGQVYSTVTHRESPCLVILEDDTEALVSGDTSEFQSLQLIVTLIRVRAAIFQYFA